MKALKRLPLAITCLVAGILFSACDHSLSIRTEVHPDGALDRTIILHETDSTSAIKNFFGISQNNGWDVTVEPLSTVEADNKKSEVKVSFKKHFASATESNSEMDASSDTLFRIASHFEKQNRWFYTYTTYHDTYRALNSFNGVPVKDYLTGEDVAFIDRLPAEGKLISKADSLYLEKLNEKIFDVYGTRAIFEDFYGQLADAIRQQNGGTQWLDTLERKKEKLFELFVKEESLEDLNDGLISIVAKLSIPLSPSVEESVEKTAHDIDQRAQFISTAYSGEYVHSISMPSTVFETNADSVSGNQLFWRPPAIKFLLQDYTMSATSREMNVWAVVVSAIVVGITVVLFVRRGR